MAVALAGIRGFRTLPALDDLAAHERDLAITRTWFGFTAGEEWAWLIVGSYHSHPVLQPECVTVTHAPSFFEVPGLDRRPLKEAFVNPSGLRAALEEMGRFYK